MEARENVSAAKSADIGDQTWPTLSKNLSVKTNTPYTAIPAIVSSAISLAS
jgi:hypothetical protein